MSSSQAGAALELEEGMALALDLLGRARRALAQGELPELGRLVGLLDGLRHGLDGAAPVDGRLVRQILALLDEAGTLASALREEQARVAARLREEGCHRRAGVAYRRAGRL